MREFASQWIPPALVRAARRAVRWGRWLRTSPEDRAALASNARLQGAYSGRRCFVIANGPSLADVDIDLLADEVTIVMNAFNQHPALGRWQPTVHCAAEPANTYSSPARIQFLRELLKGYESTIHVYPIEMRKTFNQTGLLPPERLVLVRQDGRTAAEFTRIDLTQAIPSPHDTSILAVSVAVAMGCSPIVLLGLDYNWLSHRSINRHFYDDEAVPWPVYDMADTAYLDAMTRSIKSWQAHAALRDIASRAGQDIVNATEGSYLDVYPTAVLTDILTRPSVGTGS
jgi:hypothetical protein